MTASGTIIRKRKEPLSFVNELFATTARGVEEVLAAEMTRAGFTVIAVERGGVRFSGGMEACMRANLHLATAGRILLPLASFPSPSPEDLYEGVKALPWFDLITPSMTLAVDCSLRDSAMTHSRYAALKAKDAIVDLIRERTGSRPSVDTANPDLRINLHMVADQCTLSLDSSGDPLDRRGYRLDRTEAPLRETLAAALVELTGWQGQTPFMDPLCGSGTLVIEAALRGMRRPPGLGRSTFGFQRWIGYDERLWKGLCSEAEELTATSLPCSIAGRDQDGKAIVAALQNARRAGVDRVTEFFRGPLAEARPLGDGGVIIMNPPYGERLGKGTDLPAFYRSIGDLLKRHFTGYTAFVFTGDLELAKQVGLKACRRHVLFNGPIECRLLRYELY